MTSKLHDSDWLRSAYEKGLTAKAIAGRLGCTTSSVYRALRRAGIESRPGGPVSRYPVLQDSDWLRREYQGKTAGAIAKSLGCSEALVNLAMKKHGIKARKTTERMHSFAPKPCQRCGASFTPIAPAQLFCGCRPDPELCDHCGAKPVERTRTGKRRWTYYSRSFCSLECKDSAWAASQDTPNRFVQKDGYVRMWVGRTYPGADCNGYMLEHRVVAQRSLGRPLGREETVHHINGDRADNRWENLQLRRGKHGNGHAMVCLDCGSQNVEAVALLESPSLEVDS